MPHSCTENSRKIIPRRDPRLASPRGEPISLIFLHQCDPRCRERTASAPMHLGHYVPIQKPLTGVCKSLNGNNQPLSQFRSEHVIDTLSLHRDKSVV